MGNHEARSVAAQAKRLAAAGATAPSPYAWASEQLESELYKNK